MMKILMIVIVSLSMSEFDVTLYFSLIDLKLNKKNVLVESQQIQGGTI